MNPLDYTRIELIEEFAVRASIGFIEPDQRRSRCYMKQSELAPQNVVDNAEYRLTLEIS